jgi:hypothetical protein
MAKNISVNDKSSKLVSLLDAQMGKKINIEDKIAYIDEDRYSSQDIVLSNLLSALKYVADFYIPKSL